MKLPTMLLYLCASLPAVGEMAIPARWTPPKIGGRDYWIEIIPRNYVIDNPALMSLPLHRDAVWKMRRTISQKSDYIGRILNAPQSHSGSAVLRTHNKLMLDTTCYYFETEKDLQVPESSWQAFRKTVGDRLLGTQAEECIQSYTASQTRYKLPEPKTRQEAYEILRGTWGSRDMSRFRDFSVFYDWGVPRYAGTATYFDHMLLEFGSKSAGHECGCGITDMPMQFAVSRGAARQYGTFFYSYNATHNRSLRYPGQVEIDNSRIYSHRDYNYLTPWERRVTHTPPRLTGPKPKSWHIFVTRGPECGIPDSEYRRRFIYAFFGGAGFYEDESCINFMYALYDYRSIAQEDPLVVNLRDRSYHLSKTGEMLAEFYATCASKVDRGVVCTPIALVWDRYHGYGPNYAGEMPWNGRFQMPGDPMFSALENYLFPSSPRTHENKCHRTSPFGDIFDVITNDASQEAMEAYPALLLTADVSMERGFGDRLLRYLHGGGTLIASRCQLKEMAGLPALPTAPGLAEIGVGKGRLIVGDQDYWMSNGEIVGELGGVIRRISAEALPVSVEGDVQYLVNRTRDGVVVALFNNYGSGVNRTWEVPDPPPDPKETQKVVITSKGAVAGYYDLLSGKPLENRGSRFETTLVGGDAKAIRIALQ